MQALADGVRTNALDGCHCLVDDTSIRGLQRLEIDLTAGHAHLLGENARLVRELFFAAAAIITDIDAESRFGTKLARRKPAQDVLQRRECLTAAPDQETVHCRSADSDFDFFGSRLKLHLRRNSHRREQVLRQLAQIRVLRHQSLDAHACRTLAEQAEETAAGIVENVDPNLSGFRSQFGQGGLQRFLDASPRDFHPLRHFPSRPRQASPRSRELVSVQTSG